MEVASKSTLAQKKPLFSPLKKTAVESSRLGFLSLSPVLEQENTGSTGRELGGAWGKFIEAGVGINDTLQPELWSYIFSWQQKRSAIKTGELLLGKQANYQHTKDLLERSSQ